MCICIRYSIILYIHVISISIIMIIMIYNSKHISSHKLNWIYLNDGILPYLIICFDKKGRISHLL